MTTSEQAEAFVRAVRSGDFDAADARLPLPPARDDQLRLALVDLHTHRHRWAEAAAVLDEVRQADDPVRLRRNLCRNLAALRLHRPAVYRLMMATLESAPGPFAPMPMGSDFTVGRFDPNGRLLPLSANVAGTVAQATSQLKPLIDQGQPLAFCSLGDGHVIGAIVSKPPTLQLGRQQAIYLIEPDASLLLACLLAHDWSGPLGPIEQMRVQWYVGAGWADALRTAFADNVFQLFPATNIKQGGAAAEVEKTLVGILADLGKRDAAAVVDVDKYYATLKPADYAAALRGEAGRPPRVLLLTTRFSTVLQYSTRDAADAFRQLGMDAHVLIEPEPFQGLTRTAIRRTLAEFKPDLVFQIDHHRFEHGDVFPTGLPFVNWIQDLMPHLMTAATGQKLGAADFVLTPSLQRWVDDFAYPLRQCLEFRKLTRVPERPRAWDVDEQAVAYVSNWSQTAESRVAELTAGEKGDGRHVMAAACERMVAHYADGGTLASPGDVRRLFERVLRDLDMTAEEGVIRNTASRLFDRLNNLLYRQQGLAWAARACGQLGLRLDLFGDGWDRHPQFAAFARGAVSYGAPLEALCRRAAVNLILEPFMCVSHQRLLDTLAAGGFCLVRDHSANHTAAEWLDLLNVGGANAVNSTSLRNRLTGSHCRRYDANFAECERLDAAPGGIDHVATVVRLRDGGFFPPTGPLLPLLDRTSFTTPDELTARLDHAARDPNYRATVATTQRRGVEARFGYAGGMRRVVQFVCDRLADSVHATAPKRAA